MSDDTGALDSLPGALRELGERHRAIAESTEPAWERWTLDEIADGIARVLLSRPRDEQRIRHLSGAVRDHLGSGRATRSSLRTLLRRQATAAEEGLSYRNWTPEEAHFAPIDDLAHFLGGRANKPGLPGKRPLREGDVFWILLRDRLPDSLRPEAILPLVRYLESGVDVWDVTAAARQASKRQYNAAVAGQAGVTNG